MVVAKAGDVADHSRLAAKPAHVRHFVADWRIFLTVDTVPS